MNSLNTAATAETQQNWTSGLRITEVAGSASRVGQTQTLPPAAILLQTAMEKLQTAWKWLEQKRSQQIASKRLRIAESISLGEKRTLCIVMVDGEQYLIGNSAAGVQLLTKLDAANEPSAQRVRAS